MINSSAPPTSATERRRRPSTPSSAPGRTARIAVAGIATAIVIALWFGFYFLVFLPRSA